MPMHHIVSLQSPFYAIVLAGGQGSRAGYAVPKQYAPLAGKPILAWSVDSFLTHPACRAVIVVVPSGDDARAEAALAGRDIVWAVGGSTRQQSVAAGLLKLPVEALGDAIVMIHDAARPGLDHAMIDRLLIVFNDNEISGAVPAISVADTLARADGQLGGVVQREGLVRVQTPQAFKIAAITDAHTAWRGEPASDDAQMVRALGAKVAIVDGSEHLAKVTYADDIAAMERSIMLEKIHNIMLMQTIVGMGYDVHKLIPGDGLWLGGVRIAHDQSLEGHSDADVLLHAVTDALLGALADGDIGAHFPPSDPQWRGATSDQFLTFAAKRLSQRSGVVVHIDCTIICEDPKIGPHRDAIRNRIAAILGLSVARISVKATTSEKLGFTGRKEGIAAQAVATIEIPRDAHSHE
ncbi:MAG: bifunctional 2-C-methyl-D-erythritol 4-phosphate cytidylyltransferase/2-C-methyl-D-erythritol 2,4-cyclodiphosphate synthase [Sphingopyxis sp.]